MMDMGKMMADPEAMKRFGNTVVVWDLHTRKPKKIFDVPGAPLEIRCAWGAQNNYCFTSTALTSEIWLIYEDAADGEWKAKEVADIGDASKVPLPVDISISADDKALWVNTWNDGKTRLFDVSDPHHPKLVLARQLGQETGSLGRSSVLQGLRLGWQEARPQVHGGLFERGPRCAAPNALRRALSVRRRAAARRECGACRERRATLSAGQRALQSA
jgi:hypothetical protein